MVVINLDMCFQKFQNRFRIVLITITLVLEVLLMLCNWESHENYQKKLLLDLILFCEIEKSRVASMDKSLSKLYLLNLDNLLPIIKHLYSDIGRPAENQQGIIRSLVLMLDSNEHSITNWAPKVASDRLLCAACGFEFGDAPTFPSYYDLIQRLWRSSHIEHVKRKLKPKSFYPKPLKKLKAVKSIHQNIPVLLKSLFPFLSWVNSGKKGQR